ncbi:sensor histidine kinase [Propionibacteriaceae bacterium G1746]
MLVFGYDLLFLASRFTWSEISLEVFVVALVLSLAMCTFYVFRRVAPAPVFVAIFIAAAVQSVLGVGLAPAPVLILGLMLYTLGSQARWKMVLPAVLVSGIWAAVAAVPVVRADRARVGEIGMLILAYVLAALVGRLSRSRRERIEALQERAEQLARERDARATIAAAEERARIAREIHDIVSHSLGTMVVMADGAAQTAQVDPPQAGQAMERVRDTGRTAMTEMRRMLGVLRDSDPAVRAPQPGLAQLDRLIDETRATGIRVDVTIRGVPVDLPSGVDLTAFRVVQEALTNARKHGGALMSLVTVTVAYSADSLDLSIVDDGRESSELHQDRGGHGLVGMRERVSAYGGSLQTGSRPEGGFVVRATLPLGDVG